MKNYTSLLKNKTFYLLRSKLKKFRIVLLVGFFIGVLIDIIYLTPYFDLSIFSLIVLWIIICLLYKYNSVTTLKLALIFLVILFILFITSRNLVQTERVSTWFYLVFMLGIIQQFIDLRKK